MAGAFRVAVVTPEREVLATDASFVALPAYDGEMGVMPRRAPLLVQLGSGILRVQQAGGAERSPSPAARRWSRTASPSSGDLSPPRSRGRRAATLVAAREPASSKMRGAEAARADARAPSAATATDRPRRVARSARSAGEPAALRPERFPQVLVVDTCARARELARDCSGRTARGPARGERSRRPRPRGG
jgi:hypothetical protein